MCCGACTPRGAIRRWSFRSRRRICPRHWSISSAMGTQLRGCMRWSSCLRLRRHSGGRKWRRPLPSLRSSLPPTSRKTASLLPPAVSPTWHASQPLRGAQRACWHSHWPRRSRRRRAHCAGAAGWRPNGSTHCWRSSRAWAPPHCATPSCRIYFATASRRRRQRPASFAARCSVQWRPRQQTRPTVLLPGKSCHWRCASARTSTSLCVATCAASSPSSHLRSGPT
mmetsp:Transcript_5332/g.15960  ORF Transcript_5332/g.15960 Transcript_5332/m.15960 type:complete len:225 (+) Transcript_5332:122-796(+)